MPDLTHFHIRWLPSHVLDWERFDTQKEAEARASELVLPGEKYEIEVAAQDCDPCRAIEPRGAAPKQLQKRAAS
jgi:hypothetical protein